MAAYEQSFSLAAVAAGANVFDIAASASDRIRVLEMGIFNQTAVASEFAVFRTTAIGTRTSAAAGIALDPADGASGGTTATAWSVGATLAANPFRRVQFSGNVGTGVIWTWPDTTSGALVIPLSGSIIVQAVVLSATLRIYVKWAE
jgi:hypothetical protein